MTRKARAALPILALALLLGVPAGAADLFFDGFSYPLGPISPFGDNSVWKSAGNAAVDTANNVFTMTPPGTDNLACIQLYGSHAACSAAEASRAVTLPAGGGEFFVRLDVRASGEIDNTWQILCPENRYDARASLRAAAGAPGSGVTLFEVRDGGWTNLDNVPVARNQWKNVLVRVNRLDGVKEYWIDGNWYGAYDDGALLSLGDTLDRVSLLSGGGKGWFDRVRVFTDNVPPATTASYSGTAGLAGWYLSNVSVLLSSNEPNNTSSTGSGTRLTRYRLNGGAWTSYYFPFTVSAEGTTTVEFQSADNGGNWEAVKTGTVKIDRTAPTSSPAVFPADGATGVATNVAPTATYGENVFAGPAFSSVELYNTKKGQKVNAAVSIAGPVLKVTPNAALASRTRYRVTVPANAVRDEAGNGQASAKVWYFTTK